eukprot:g11107.t1
MLELLPGHSQQDVLPNIPPFIKNCHQGSVKTRHADITESSKYHFAALQAQSSALLYAFPVQDRRMKTFADWTREGKKNPNSPAARAYNLIYTVLSQHFMLVGPRLFVQQLKARFKYVKLRIAKLQKSKDADQGSSSSDSESSSSSEDSSSDSDSVSDDDESSKKAKKKAKKETKAKKKEELRAMASRSLSSKSSKAVLVDDNEDQPDQKTPKPAGMKRKPSQACSSGKAEKKAKKGDDDEDEEEDEESQEGKMSDDSNEGESDKGGKGKSNKGAFVFSDIEEDTAEMVRRVSKMYAVGHNLIQNGKRLRRQEGLASGFLHLGQVSKSIGLGVVVVPKIPHGGKKLWCAEPWMPIMKYVGKIMTNAQYSKHTRDCKQVYGVMIGEDENLAFTAEYRSKVLDAAACGHDALHAALVNGGGGSCSTVRILIVH